MMWVFAILMVLVLGVVAAVAAGRVGFLPPTETRLGAEPPSGPLSPDDLRGVRFTLALRGYRMDEVDALLDRVAAQWEAQAEAPAQPGRRRGEPAVPPVTGPDHRADPS
ncbi:DivIVA domain-containing protein [Nocardioides jishulii]|uniref:DivIVA domain-containing protein n=1 Tax=Nocardioides jishulii TaxID=2575440 RepID=A0A4U2YJF9_9ACTN|nr:DivIVA domain-containing protein [Nocardioides jishulii]QCX26774.1 DivIVA domain-containing protein [Nocardioides jishulii]TKI61258.1 DivIVA domain-containing protein [Nocardioides jishulii]